MLAEDAQLDRHVWIRRLTAGRDARLCASSCDGRDPTSLPLYGIPFAIKDNIDLAGVPTTAACPEFAYTPETQRHRGAAPDRCRRHSRRQDQPGPVRHRPGRHALALRRLPQRLRSGLHLRRLQLPVRRWRWRMGLASFSLGTDTAGSGRVPAASTTWSA